MNRRLVLILTLVVCTLLPTVCGCGAAGPEGERALDRFVRDLQSQGFIVLGSSFISDPIDGAQIIVLATDSYAAVGIQSRIYREAAVAKATGAYPFTALSVRTVDASGLVLSETLERVDGLPLPSQQPAMSDSEVADRVRFYLNSEDPHRIAGLLLTSTDVSTLAHERTLRLGFQSDETARASESLEWLAIGATSEDGWVGDLNREGLGLTWIEIRVAYASDLADSLSVIDVARRSVSTYSGGRQPDFGPRPYTTTTTRF